ncbi:MAG: homoserine dehydrogenase, partial [Gemmatimonadaceae bacterium]
MAPPVLRIGLIGNGTVGAAFSSALAANSERIARRLPARVRLTQVAVRSPDLHGRTIGGARVHDDAAALAADPAIDIVVEASGAAHAGEWLRRALARGAAAVSANKLAIASDDALLSALARREPRLQCEAAVAAAVPVVRALRDSLDCEEIYGIRGVLNGTTTFVLSKLEQGYDFETALACARELGYAEADASADLSGRDAAAKLAILATLAWRRPVSIAQITTRGIDANIAELVRVVQANGARVRLVAEATKDQTNDAALRLTVEPRVLGGDDRLAQADGVTNIVEVQSALAGSLTWFGPGAGGRHTASALLGDLLVAARALTGTHTATSLTSGRNAA